MGSHHHYHHHIDGATTQSHLKFGIVLNLVFAVVEVIIGLVSNSIAILTDSIHDFADSGSLFIALIAARVSERPSDVKRSFGYRRVSILAALLNASILLGTIGFVFYHALKRLFVPTEVISGYMFLTAALSIIVNGAAVLRMYKDRKANLNLEGAFWHLMEDALGGLALLLGGLIIHFTQWFWVDGLLSLVLGVIVLRGALGIVAQSVHIFLEGTPEDIDPEEIKQVLLAYPGVKEVHHLHIWALDSNHYNMSVHIRLHDQQIPPGLYKELQKRLREFGISHLTVQLEGPQSECLPCRS